MHFFCKKEGKNAQNERFFVSFVFPLFRCQYRADEVGELLMRLRTGKMLFPTIVELPPRLGCYIDSIDVGILFLLLKRIFL